MENINTLEEDILNALIENKCKNTLVIFKLIKRHIALKMNNADIELNNLKVKYANLEHMYNRILDHRNFEKK